MNKPFFTVIVPCLNEEALLESCVISLVNYFENAKTTFEVLIVDDGSTDRTFEIASTLSKRDPERVRVLRQPRNFGVGRAISDGLANARGTFAFCQCADMPF